MISCIVPKDFQEFRAQARELISQSRAPESVFWETSTASLFSGTTFLAPSSGMPPSAKSSESSSPFLLSRDHFRLLRTASMHRNVDIWALLYRLLWAVHLHGQNFLNNPADPDVLECMRRAKQVSRDIHKMHAFVRFRKVTVEPEPEYFVAWFVSRHRILQAAVPFFVKRFGAMHWSILTPDGCAHWNMQELSFSEGLPADPFSGNEDRVEDWWLRYYSAIFNPARVKVSAMKQEMPVAYWGTLPEAQLIPQLIREAPQRVEAMQAQARPRAAIPDSASLEELHVACSNCQSCPIACLEGKVVFGEGPEDAQIVIVGEQPGDEEEKVGRPFVGPAGILLDEALSRAGFDRSSLYITNAVKHFKWVPRGKRRLHQRPTGSEILACYPWLEAELKRVKPKVIVCLGATAAQSVLGIQVRISEAFGEVFSGPDGSLVVIACHPSLILRIAREEDRAKHFEEIVATLRRAESLVAELVTGSEADTGPDIPTAKV